MKYVYTADMCGNCIALKKKYKDEGIEYIERSADRLKAPAGDYDSIDREAFAQLSFQNMELPVVVESEAK